MSNLPIPQLNQQSHPDSRWRFWYSFKEYSCSVSIRHSWERDVPLEYSFRVVDEIGQEFHILSNKEFEECQEMATANLDNKDLEEWYTNHFTFHSARIYWSYLEEVLADALLRWGAIKLIVNPGVH